MVLELDLEFYSSFSLHFLPHECFIGLVGWSSGENQPLLMLLKMRSGTVQNGLRIVIFDYDLAVCLTGWSGYSLRFI